MSFNVSYIYRVLDKFSRPLRNLKKSQDKVNVSLAKGHRKAKKLSDAMGNVGGGMQATAAAASLGLMAVSASNLEDKMADVKRVSDMSKEAIDDMQGSFSGLSMETGKAASGFADIAYQAAKTGIASKDLERFSLNTIKVANAFDMVEGEAGRALGSIRTKLGSTVSGVDELMNRINYLADSTASDGARMVNIVERTSGTMKLWKIPTDMVAGWASFADQVERSPERAATGLSGMMSKLAQIPGMTERMLANPRTAVIEAMKSIAAMEETARIKFIRKHFGTGVEGAAGFVPKLVTKINLLDDAMKKAADTAALTSIDKEWQNYLGRTSTRFARLKQTVLVTFRSIGTIILRTFDKIYPQIQKAADMILEFTRAHPNIVKFGLAIAAIAIVGVAVLSFLGAIAAAVASITFMVAGFGIGWGVAIAAIGAFALASAKFIAIAAVIVAAFNAIGKAIGFTMFVAVEFFETMGDILPKVWRDIKQVGDELLDLPKKLKAGISGVGGKVWEGISSAPSQVWEGMFGEKGNIVAENAKATQMSLTGGITVGVEKGATVTNSDISSSHGNLGMNMAGAY